MPVNSWIGQTLGGRYRIEEMLGQGGMSAVYKAGDRNLRRVVAVKMIHSHLSDNPEFVRRFEEEATAVAQLRHENIISVYDFNHDDDVYYMVLEYIPGETLQERLRRLNTQGRRLEPAEAIDYMIQVCEAVSYAHERGMIHRDIKPANIMLDVRGRVVLMDFGIARIMGGQLHTATGAVIGTAMYMSPEQVRGDRADERSDIYSLGVTLFEAVSGKPPFMADSAMSLMMMHLHDAVPDIRSLQPQVPDALVSVIGRALEKRRELRYQTAAEMAAALRGVYFQLTGSAVRAPAAPGPAAYPAIPPADRLPADNLTPPSYAANTPPAFQPSQPAPAAPAAGQPPAYPPQGAQPAGYTPPNPPVYPSQGYQGPVNSQPPATAPQAAPALRSGDMLRSPLVIGAGALALIALIALVVALQVVLNRPTAAATPTSAAVIAAAAATATQPPATLAPAPPVVVEPTAIVLVQNTPTSAPILPTATPAPPTPEPSPTPTIPDRPFVLINKISVVDNRYVVEYTAFNYTPVVPGMHMHFFFDTVKPENAGVPGNGPWKMYGGPSPFTDSLTTDRPGPSTRMCVLVTNANHTVQLDSGNCLDLPDV